MTPLMYAPPATALIGVLLLIHGWRGRRVGDEPRCRRCRYNLTGSASEVCPECGSALQPRGIVIGVRRRRHLVVFLGLLLFMASSAFLVTGVRQKLAGVNWHRYCPMALLRFRAERGNAKALEEIDLRVAYGNVSTGQARRLAEFALARQVAAVRSAADETWLDVLHNLCVRRTVGEPTVRQYLRQSTPFVVRMRSPIRAGDPLVVQLEFELRAGGPERINLTNEVTNLSVGGISCFVPPHHCAIDDGQSCICRPCKMVLPSAELPAGKQAVSVTVSRTASLRTVSELWLEEAAAEVEILPPDSPDPLIVHDDPAAIAEARSNISAFYVADDSDTEGEWTSSDGLQIRSRSAAQFPIHGFFEVTLVCLQGEVVIGTARLEQGPNWWERLDVSPEFRPQGDFALRFDADIEAARQSVDLFEVWSGSFESGPFRRYPGGSSRYLGGLVPP